MLGAWALLRPSKPFGGLTLSQFNDAIKPSLDARAMIARLEVQLAQAREKCEMADQVSIGLLSHVVASVKADPTEGEDGELLEAMGFSRSAAAGSAGHSPRLHAEASSA